MAKTSLEQRVARLEAELAQLKSQQQPPQKPQPQQSPSQPEPPWWESVVGMFADNPTFEAVVEHGREYRQSLAKIESAAAALEDLPSKSLEAYSLHEAVIALQDDITHALDRHYTFAEIAQILTEQGICINAEQLQQHYTNLSPKHQAQSTTASLGRHPRSKPRSQSTKSLNYASPI